MNEKTVKEILNLNKKFYQSVSDEFSKTRRAPWSGWGRVVEVVKKVARGKAGVLTKIKILDLGCGNGRFYEFIKKELPNIDYTGVDINNDLLRKAKEKYKDARFIKKDIFEKLNSVKGEFDVVVVFGITHHLPDEKFRNVWFAYLPKLLSKNGVLILTFWDFEKLPGDYLIGWNNKKDTARFCHQYSKKELETITKTFKKAGLSCLDSYEADKNNWYFLFGKI